MGSPKRLGILVGGGPAPGINTVISAATIEARNQGFDVIGIVSTDRAETSAQSAAEMRVVLNWLEELKARVPIK